VEKAPVVTPFRDEQLSVQCDGPEVNLLDAIAGYTITVANQGNSTATDLQVRLTIPRGLRVTTLEVPADFDAERGMLTWRVNRLGAGEQEQFRFKARTVEPGSHVQRIEAWSRGVVIAQHARRLEVLAQVAREEARGPVTFAVSDERAE
jgi:uncharacterized repeat protein (TIGR01451 family)